MVDEGTNEKYTRAVGQTGMAESEEIDWLVKDACAELKVWGHAGGTNGKIILKVDGERAIGAVKDAIAKYHGGRVVPDSPAKGESKSNGRAEEAGKTVREFTRVLKDQIEEKAHMTIKCEDVITLWMVRWAAMLCSRYLVGHDGRTGYERRRGRRCKIKLAGCGERV